MATLGPKSDRGTSITALLAQLSRGNREVEDRLVPQIYEQLRRLEALQQQHERQRQADQGLLSKDARARILALAQDFPRVWNDPRTEARERKRMLALLIEDVTLVKGDEIALTTTNDAGMDFGGEMTLKRQK